MPDELPPRPRPRGEIFRRRETIIDDPAASAELRHTYPAFNIPARVRVNGGRASAPTTLDSFRDGCFRVYLPCEVRIGDPIVNDESGRLVGVVDQCRNTANGDRPYAVDVRVDYVLYPVPSQASLSFVFGVDGRETVRITRIPDRRWRHTIRFNRQVPQGEIMYSAVNHEIVGAVEGCEPEPSGAVRSEVGQLVPYWHVNVCIRDDIALVAAAESAERIFTESMQRSADMPTPARTRRGRSTQRTPGRSPRPRPTVNTEENASRERNRETDRRRREQRHASGLCECGEPSRPGLKICQACTDRKLQYRRTLTPAQRTARNRERIRAGKCVNCGANDAVSGSKYCEKCRATSRRHNARTEVQLKSMAFHAYGGPRCRCCGETREGFLTIEKIDVAGVTRARIGSSRLFFNLKRLGYPEGWGVYCHNCNNGRQTTADGSCPCGRAAPVVQTSEPTTTIAVPRQARMRPGEITGSPLSVTYRRGDRVIEFDAVVLNVQNQQRERHANTTLMTLQVVGGLQNQ